MAEFNKNELHEREEENLEQEKISVRTLALARRTWKTAQTKKIQTMWSEEYQSWCRWDATANDYIPLAELNR